MGDDSNITIIVPEPESSTEKSYEEIGEQLLARLDSLDQRIEELSDAITACIERITTIEGFEYATSDHTHEGLATSDHTHDGYSPTDHTHPEPTREKREKDKEPENQHFYFRRFPDNGG